jgi:hypothetical protein
MRRKVITYWQMQSDERGILAKIDRIHGMLAFPAIYVTEPSVVCASTISDAIEGGQDHLLLARDDQRSCVHTESRELSGVQRWGISAIDSCVIGYSRGLMMPDGRLPLSNIYAYMDHLSAGAVEAKSAAFAAWCNKIFGIVRRATPASYKTYRATQAALDAHQSGTVKLVEY